MAQFDTRKAPPDAVWYYAGLNTELLGLILTRATRMHLAAYFADRIWQKIGAEADASWVVDAAGQEAAFCSVNAALRDWARLAVLVANDGVWNGVQVIPRQWFEMPPRPRRPGISWRRARRRSSTGTAIRYGSCPARAGSSRCLVAMGDDPR